MWSKRWFEAAGYVVLYGDTDSLFVQAATVDRRRRPATQGQEIAAALNADLAHYVAERWRVQSRLELKFEKLYLRLFLPHARGTARAAPASVTRA